MHQLQYSIHPGMKRSSSSHLASVNELVWKNGQILVQGGSSNRTQNTPPPPCIKEAKDHEDPIITPKRTKLTTSSYSLLDPIPAHTHPRKDQYSSQMGMDFSQNKSSSDVKEESKLPTTTATYNGHLCTYSSSQQCLPSTAPFKKPRTDSSQTQAATNSQKQYLGCHHQRTGKLNFSNFLIPAVFLKSSSHQGNNTTTQQPKTASLARGVVVKGIIEEEKFDEKAALATTTTSSKALDASTVIESGNKGSHDGHTGFQNQTSLTPNHKSNPASLVARSEAQVQPLDEHSEAVGHTYYNSAIGIHGFQAKGKAIISNLCTSEPLLASSSVCSLGASNDPNICITKQDDTDDDSTYLSDNDEETEDGVKEIIPAWEGNRIKKRSRNAEIHSLTERKRRDKINKKMRALKELIPNCNKMDRASMLDDAIDYLKTLKLQLQIMSMGNGLCMPLMMLPGATHHLNAPQLPQLMGPPGMCLRPGTGFPCNPPQFPIIAPPLSGITDNRHQMFGFSNQMPIPHAPFIPMIGNSSNTYPIVPTTTATNLPEHIANPSQLTNQEPKNSDFHAKAENGAMQPSN